MSTRPLTTTSYAILGVLAMRSWSAYDLTGYMRTSAVRHLWPRTESRLYAEPKNLVAHGLASAAKEYTGKRSRTVYSITEEGRSALASWLEERAQPPQTEDEAMLKIFLADFGSITSLTDTIRSAAEDIRVQIETIRDIADRVQRGEGLFPQRLHVTALSGSYTLATLRQRFAFLRWLREHTGDWKHTGLDDTKRVAARRLLEERRAELDSLDREIEEFLGG